LGCATKQRDELAPLHSITSSARASSVGGISSPSAFAVMQNSSAGKFHFEPPSRFTSFNHIVSAGE
jgi:hypothetical protein